MFVVAVFWRTVRKLVLCCRPSRAWVRWCHHCAGMDRRFATILSMSGGGPARRSVGRVRKRKVASGAPKSRRLIGQSKPASIASLRQSAEQARLRLCPSKKFQTERGGGGIITVRQSKLKSRRKRGLC